MHSGFPHAAARKRELPATGIVASRMKGAQAVRRMSHTGKRGITMRTSTRYVTNAISFAGPLRGKWLSAGACNAGTDTQRRSLWRWACLGSHQVILCCLRCTLLLPSLCQLKQRVLGLLMLQHQGPEAILGSFQLCLLQSLPLLW